jgi:hypothetical protein
MKDSSVNRRQEAGFTIAPGSRNLPPASYLHCFWVSHSDMYDSSEEVVSAE